MPYSYENVLNLQGSDSTVQEVLHTIQHPDFGIGSIDFAAITPIPLWASCNNSIGEAWMWEHWGVSENASGLDESVATYDGGDTIEFYTKCSDVRELMRLLSLMFPHLADLVVDYVWASEDVGKDCGSVQFQQGELLYEYIPTPGDPDACELAFDVFGTEPADHGLMFDKGLGVYRYSSQNAEKEDEDEPEA